METFQALARTSTRSQSWLGIKWLGRTHWWIWHGGTCAYFLICVIVIYILRPVIIFIFALKAFMIECWSMPLTGLDKNLNPYSLTFGEALNFCLPWAKFALLAFDLVGRWLPAGPRPSGQVRMKVTSPATQFICPGWPDSPLLEPCLIILSIKTQLTCQSILG